MRGEDLADVAREAHGRGRQRRGAGHAAAAAGALRALAGLRRPGGDEGAAGFLLQCVHSGPLRHELAAGARRREIALAPVRHLLILLLVYARERDAVASLATVARRTRLRGREGVEQGAAGWTSKDQTSAEPKDGGGGDRLPRLGSARVSLT